MHDISMCDCILPAPSNSSVFYVIPSLKADFIKWIELDFTGQVL